MEHSYYQKEHSSKMEHSYYQKWNSLNRSKWNTHIIKMELIGTLILSPSGVPIIISSLSGMSSGHNKGLTQEFAVVSSSGKRLHLLDCLLNKLKRNTHQNGILIKMEYSSKWNTPIKKGTLILSKGTFISKRN